MSLGVSLLISVNPPLLVVTITDCKLLIGSVNFLYLHLPHLGGTCTMLTTLSPQPDANFTRVSLQVPCSWFLPSEIYGTAKASYTQLFHWLCECCTLQWDCWPNSTWGSFRLSVLSVDSVPLAVIGVQPSRDLQQWNEEKERRDYVRHLWSLGWGQDIASICSQSHENCCLDDTFPYMRIFLGTVCLTTLVEASHVS